MEISKETLHFEGFRPYDDFFQKELKEMFYKKIKIHKNPIKKKWKVTAYSIKDDQIIWYITQMSELMEITDWCEAVPRWNNLEKTTFQWRKPNVLPPYGHTVLVLKDEVVSLAEYFVPGGWVMKKTLNPTQPQEGLDKNQIDAWSFLPTPKEDEENHKPLNLFALVQ